MYAVLHPPNFFAQAAAHQRPQLRKRPFVVLDGEPPTETVFAANNAARSQGVEIGMTRLQAEAFSEVVTFRRVIEHEHTANAILHHVACMFSPRIESVEERPGTYALDIRGMDLLYGDVGQLANKLRRSVMSAGFLANIAVAENFHAAVSLAYGRTGVSVVPSGCEAHAIGQLPVTALHLAPEHEATFAAWGIRTCAELAALAETDVIARLGQVGKKLHSLARGAWPHLMFPIEPSFEAGLVERMELDFPVEELERLMFLLSRMTTTLLERVRGKARAITTLRVALRLDGGAQHERTVRPALPLQDTATLLKLIQLDLETHPPGAGIVGLELHAQSAAPYRAQHGLFLPQAPEPGQLEVMLARMRKLLGEQRVGSPELTDDHRPNAFRMVPFEPPTPRRSEKQSLSTPVALRVSRPPHMVGVALANQTPVRVFWDGAAYAVRDAAGPVRVNGQWWSEANWCREEWDVRLENGTVERLCRIAFDPRSRCCTCREHMTDYVELHARSAFSFLEGATMPEFLMQQAAHLEMPAMALLDRNGLYGAARFHMEGQRCGVRAHIGAEVAVSDLGQRLQPAAYLPHQLPAEPVRLPLLAESRIGYQNLSRLLTQFKLRETTKAEGAAALADVEEYGKGLVCLTGGIEGPLAATLVRGGYDAAHKAVEKLVHLFGSGNVYVELQRHFDREEEHRNRAAIRIARSLNLPLLATGGVSYGTPYEREVLDIFTCIRHRKTLDTGGRLLSRNAERHLHTAVEMHRLFYDYPEAVANTRELSDRLQFQMTGLGYEFPAYPVPDGETMDSFLRKRVDEGMRRRYLPKNHPALYEKAKRQAERELRLIEKLGLAGYFLIVWDVVCFCKDNGIFIQGRGSAANSVVCYALEITIVDSVGLDLLFERFLSEERGEWPDIDLDLPSDTDRERAIQYVYQRYGELGAAMTANVITFRSRSASREVGKALGFDQETAAKLAGLMSAWEWKAPSDTLENSFKAAGLDMKHRRIAHYLQKCGDVLRLPRNLGQHSGGMVICQGHLDSVVPIERATMPGRTVVQWDKDDCSDMGIIKVDLLGLGMLAVLKDAAYLVPQYYGEQLDYAQLPQDDAVYESIQQADTVGLFQIESRAQMSALPRTKPQCFADLSMQVAIIRPGPVTGKFVNPYIARRLGREPVTYLHPSFKPFLERTLGVPLFQEQVMKIGIVAANLTGGEAEELRKAMGGKRSEAIIAGLKTRLHEGMTANGFDAAAQEEVMRVLATVKEFMFPESHAHSFASIAYSSAYTRHHYPAAYTCALFNNQPMGFYSPATIANDAKRHGVKIVPIDVQRSDWFCTLEKLSEDDRARYAGRYAVRMGMKYVKGLRQRVADAITEARLLDGPYASEYDLRRRVWAIKKPELTLLAKAGAFNWTGEKHHRRTALWNAERAGQSAGPLFEHVRDEHELQIGAPLRPMTTEERLVADFDSTGVTLGPHPMAYHRAAMNAAGVLPAARLRGLPDGTYARIAGAVIARQRPGTAEGFIFLSLEDETGISNAIINPQLYERNRITVTRGKFLRVDGTLQNQDGVVHVRASAVHVLAFSDVEMQSHDFH